MNLLKRFPNLEEMKIPLKNEVRNNIFKIKTKRRRKTEIELQSELDDALKAENYELAVKNDVYVLASKEIDDSIYIIGLAVYFNDLETEAVSATPKALSNELTGFILKASIIKVILLVSDEFDQSEKDYLRYNSVIHKNYVYFNIFINYISF